MKICSKCGSLKPFTDFYKTGGNNRRSDCKKCCYQAKKTGSTHRNWENGGYHDKAVSAIVLENTIREYEWKFKVIDIFGLNPNKASDTAKINKIIAKFE